MKRVGYLRLFSLYKMGLAKNLGGKLIQLIIGSSMLMPITSCSTDYFFQTSVRGSEQGQNYSCEYLTAPDGTLFRTEHFNESNEPIIVGAHGFASNGEGIAKNLQGNNVLAITFPSNPGSDLGTDHSIQYDAKIFRQMINHYRGNTLREEKYIIAGYSRGGFVVLQDAVNMTRKMKAQGLEDNVGRVIIVSQDKQPDTQGFYVLGGLVNFLNFFPYFNTEAQTDSFNQVFGFNLREELKETTCNFVFVGGGRDPLIDKVEETAKNLGSRAHCYILPDAGHDIPQKELARIIKEETSFLMKLP